MCAVSNSTSPSVPLLQCQHNGQINAPNIPDFYFNHENAAAGVGDNLTISTQGVTHIFTLPLLLLRPSCNTTLIALEFCYRAGRQDENITRSAFNFLSLTRNGQIFTVQKRFRARFSPSRNCTSLASSSDEQICCDRTILNKNQKFQIDLRDYIGVVIRYFRLLEFSSQAGDYLIQQFQNTSFGSRGPAISSNFTLDQGSLANRSLLLLRLLIGRQNATGWPVEMLFVML